MGYPPVRVPPSGQVQWGVPKLGYPLSGVPLARSDQEGYQGGVPPIGVPPARSDGGVAKVGYPSQAQWGYPRWCTPIGVPLPIGVPPARSDRGYPRWGTPIRVPPGWTWQGVPPTWTWTEYPLGVDREMDGWMDRHVSKHNLPSLHSNQLQLA